MRYALDSPRLSFLQQLNHQPFPAKPEGLPVADWAFELSLSAWVPLATAVVYLIATHATNNRFGPGKPKPVDLIKQSYGLSQTVLGHNILLAAYSGWTFFHTATRSLSYLFGGVASNGLSGLANAYCTVPVADSSFAGLGIYVWLFYISKYYEIIDSVILILKGKPVSHLQSYHHAGAILCMWAGYRYSAPAIFIFLLFNSFVHTLMYTYYSMTAMKLPFTGGLKRSMTTVQITQLVVGWNLAAAFLVLRYNPLAYPAGAMPSPGKHILNPATAAFSSFQSVTNATSATGLISTTSTEAIQLIKQNILNHLTPGQTTTSCVSTSGQLFGVILNVAYLIPLIYLFVSFYIRSYQKKAAKAQKAQ